MSTYRAKHRSRGRYGIITPEDEWLNNFLGSKEQAQAKADELNQQFLIKQPMMVVKATNSVHSNKNRKNYFTLTDKGWINTGE